MKELRWHPLQKEWIINSSKRKKRFSKSNPFAKTSPEMKGKIIPAILPNKFPNFSLNPPNPTFDDFYKTSKSYGRCDVLVESESEEGDFDDLDVDDIFKILMKIREHSVDLERDISIKYINIFKNKGKEVGSSIPHPHTQIYGMPFTPPVISKEIESSKEFYDMYGTSIFEKIVKSETKSEERIIFQDNNFVAFVPFYAKWPYEINIMPKFNIQFLKDFNKKQLTSLANQIKTVVGCYNNLLEHKMSYVMLFHQSPNNEDHPYYRFYIEFQPIFQSSNKLKHAAGIERLGTFEAGFENPNEQAKKLKKLI